MLLTLNVSASLYEFTAVRAEVVPAGRADTAKLTLFARPIWFAMVISIGRFQPSWPTRRVRLFADEERLKLGTGMIRAIVAERLTAPVLPKTVSGYVPGIAVALAVTVSVIGLVEVTVGQLNFVVTPVGTPDTERFTMLLLSPIALTTLMVLLTLPPPTMRVRLLNEDERLKLG